MTMLGPPLVQIDRTYVMLGGRKLSYFGGCDYFRVACDPATLRSLQDATRRQGGDVAASRLTTGNHPVYGALEREVARWFGAPAAVLLPCGSMTNLAVAEALAGTFSHLLMDERAHGCLREAALRFGGRLLEFAHRNPRSLAGKLTGVGRSSRILLLTDGVFGRDGSVAPLAEYRSILPASAWMLVDDAHGAGVIGKRGRGTLEFAGIGRKQVIQTITLSKAFGVFGGVVLLGSPSLARKIVRGRWFGGSTPLPPALAATAAWAVRRHMGGQTRRRRLARQMEWIRERMSEPRPDPAEFPGPVVEVAPRNPAEVAALKASLLRRRIYPSFIRYPDGPDAGYYRFAISSEHTRAQLTALLEAIREVRG